MSGEIVLAISNEPLPIAQPQPLPVTSGGSSQFKGVLGIWPWPIINLLMVLAAQNRGSVASAGHRRMTVWSIDRDQSGRIISILEREAEA